MRIRGVIFDLDGTLVDSRLDFDQMRREMGLPPGQPVLEALVQLAGDEARRCWAILQRHEAAGARRATLIPGADELLLRLAARGIRCGVFTRNSRRLTREVLGRLGLTVEPVVCREDGPVKPDPAGVLAICRGWGLGTREVLVVGDFRFDIEAGRRAGARTALFTRGRDPAELPFAAEADYVLASFTELEVAALLVWCNAPGD